jgi:hypothetical protein
MNLLDVSQTSLPINIPDSTPQFIYPFPESVEFPSITETLLEGSDEDLEDLNLTDEDFLSTIDIEDNELVFDPLFSATPESNPFPVFQPLLPTEGLAEITQRIHDRNVGPHLQNFDNSCRGNPIYNNTWNAQTRPEYSAAPVQQEFASEYNPTFTKFPEFFRPSEFQAQQNAWKDVTLTKIREENLIIQQETKKLIRSWQQEQQKTMLLFIKERERTRKTNAKQTRSFLRVHQKLNTLLTKNKTILKKVEAITSNQQEGNSILKDLCAVLDSKIPTIEKISPPIPPRNLSLNIISQNNEGEIIPSTSSNNPSRDRRSSASRGRRRRRRRARRCRGYPPGFSGSGPGSTSSDAPTRAG